MQLNESALREKIKSLKEKLVALEGLVDGSGNPVTSGGQPVQTGANDPAGDPSTLKVYGVDAADTAKRTAAAQAAAAQAAAPAAAPAAAAPVDPAAGQAAAIASGQPDDASGVDAAVAAQAAAPTQSAAPAGTTAPNYDSMPFGKAFAAAKAAGASQFVWKGKPYNTQSAGAKTTAPAANPEAAKVDAEIKRFSSTNDMSLQANKDYVAKLQAKKTGAAPQQTPAAAPAGTTAAAPVMARPSNPMQANVWDQHYGKTNNPDGTPKAVKENTSVSFATEDSLARIIQLSR